MFRRATSQDIVDTVVGKSTELRGRLSGTGSVQVEGRFQGEIDVEGDVIIGEDGHVVADVRARDVVIAGHVQGDVKATGRVELLQSAKLYGDMHARQLIVAEGAVFKGACATEVDADGSRAQPTEGASGRGSKASSPASAGTGGGSSASPAAPASTSLNAATMFSQSAR